MAMGRMSYFHGMWLRCATCAFMPTTHPPPPLPGMLAKIPEQAVGNLQRLLNTANSPIISMPLPGKRPAPSSSNPALPFSQQYLAYGPVEAEAMRRASAAAAEAILAKAEEWGRRGKQEAAGR